MPRPIYSYVLTAQLLTAAGYGTPVFPPEGFQWIVRQITVFQPASAAAGSWLVADTLSGLAIAAASYLPGTQFNVFMEEFRHVIDESGGLYPFTTVPDTEFYISGYQLSVP